MERKEGNGKDYIGVWRACLRFFMCRFYSWRGKIPRNVCCKHLKPTEGYEEKKYKSPVAYQSHTTSVNIFLFISPLGSSLYVHIHSFTWWNILKWDYYILPTSVFPEYIHVFKVFSCVKDTKTEWRLDWNEHYVPFIRLQSFRYISNLVSSIPTYSCISLKSVPGSCFSIHS